MRHDRLDFDLRRRDDTRWSRAFPLALISLAALISAWVLERDVRELVNTRQAVRSAHENSVRASEKEALQRRARPTRPPWEKDAAEATRLLRSDWMDRLVEIEECASGKVVVTRILASGLDRAVTIQLQAERFADANSTLACLNEAEDEPRWAISSFKRAAANADPRETKTAVNGDRFDLKISNTVAARSP